MYNHYDLVPVTVFGESLMARTVEFDSVPVHGTSYNAFGGPVKPSRVMTTCPRCGACIECAVILSDPPFQPAVINCEECNPTIVEKPKPVVKPAEPVLKLSEKMNLNKIGKVIEKVVDCHSSQFRRQPKDSRSVISIPLTDLGVGPEEDLSGFAE